MGGREWLVAVGGDARTARAHLLVHLGARRDAVDGHEEHLARAHGANDAVNVARDRGKHLSLRLGRGAVLRVHARVDDAVHVEVQVVELDAIRACAAPVDGHAALLLLLDDGRDALGVLVAQPAVKGGDAHRVRRQRKVRRSRRLPL